MNDYSEKQRRQDYAAVFGGDAGQRVLSDLLRACGTAHSSYVRGDPGHSAFLEGRRSIGILINRIVKGTDHERDNQLDPDRA